MQPASASHNQTGSIAPPLSSAIAAILRLVNQLHSVIGHRVRGGSRVRRCNSTLAALPGGHLSLTRAPGSTFCSIPPVARSPISTASQDANVVASPDPFSVEESRHSWVAFDHQLDHFEGTIPRPSSS
jgi:hypothetical protein